MTIITTNSISGITSITAQSGNIVFYDTSGNIASIVTSINSINGGPISGTRNRIINGDCKIAQRGTSFSTNNTRNFGVDRFACNASTNATITYSQSTEAPSNFNNSLKATVNTPYSSLSASDANYVLHVIEGYNFGDFGFGTSAAKTFTVSFYVRSSLTGTFSFGFQNSGASRWYLTTYTINSANTWEYKTITIAGDTTGTWLNNNGIGIIAFWDLGSGSNYVTSSTNSWQAGSGTAGLRTSGSVSFAGNSGATWQITGVQLEQGTVATPFEHHSYGQELALCQRYFYLHRNYMGQTAPFNSEATGAVGQSSASTIVYRAVRAHPVEMRSTPTVAFANVDIWDGGAQRSVTSINNNNSSIYTRSVDWNMNGAMTALGRPAIEFVQPSGYISCTAEL